MTRVGVPGPFHAYSRVTIGLLVVLCWSTGLIPIDPPQIAQHASYHSPLHLLRTRSISSELRLVSPQSHCNAKSKLSSCTKYYLLILPT